MTYTPSFTDLYRELSQTFDVLRDVGEDHLKASPARRTAPRHPDERAGRSQAVARPVEDVVFDENRLVLSNRREELVRMLAYIETRLPDLRSNLTAAHNQWSGADHIV